MLDDEGVVAEDSCIYIPCGGCVSYSITASAWECTGFQPLRSEHDCHCVAAEIKETTSYDSMLRSTKRKQYNEGTVLPGKDV